jgi:hypothetical protein
VLSIGIQTDLKLIVPNDYLDFHNTMRHQAKKQVGVTVVRYAFETLMCCIKQALSCVV